MPIHWEAGRKQAISVIQSNLGLRKNCVVGTERVTGSGVGDYLCTAWILKAVEQIQTVGDKNVTRATTITKLKFCRGQELRTKCWSTVSPSPGPALGQPDVVEVRTVFVDRRAEV